MQAGRLAKQRKNKQVPTDLFDCIKTYAAAGYATFPAQKNKAPMRGYKWKQAIVDQSPSPLKYPEGMFGVKLKADDLIIDLDPRNMEGRKVWSELKEEFPDLTETEHGTVVQTQSGGKHLYLRKPPHMPIRKHMPDYPGVDFLTNGCYVIGAGSKGYRFLTPPFIEMQAPTPLLNMLKKPVVDHGEIRHKGWRDSGQNKGRYREYLEKTAPPAIEGKQGDQTTFKVACRGRDYNLSPVVTHQLMLKYYNPRCKPAWSADELMHKVRNAYEYNEAPPGTKDPKVALPDIEVKKKWQDTLRRYSKGQIKSSLYNCVKILKNDQNIKGKFAMNEFTEQLEVTGSVPWEEKRVNRYRQINDLEVEHIRFYLDDVWQVEFSSANIWKSVALAAGNNHYHPIRDWLETLKWDGKPRVDTWLQKYLGTPDKDLYRQMGRKFLVAMLKRVYEPGCKFDFILVMEGIQGVGKSTACAILGGDWFGDMPIDPRDKDSVSYIHSHWVIEIAEMLMTKRSNADLIKNFISRTKDDVRLPYARTRTKYPRQCVFIGTINPDSAGYLADPTGNRRYWPIPVLGVDRDDKLGQQQVDFEGFANVREHLLAEAKQIYERGEQLMLPHHLIQEREKENLKRLATDPWENLILEYLEMNPEVVETSTAELYRDALGGSVMRLNTGHQRRIGQILRRNGWRLKHTNTGNKFEKIQRVEKDSENS